MFYICNFRHGFNIGTKKNRASNLILALLNDFKADNYLALPPPADTAAAQITRPNAILLIKSAKL